MHFFDAWNKLVRWRLPALRILADRCADGLGGGASLRRAASTLVRMAASLSADHLARYPLVTYRAETAGRR